MSTPNSNATVAQLQDQLATLRARRRRVRQCRQKQEDHIHRTEQHLNQLNLQQEEALMDYRSAVYQQRRAASLLQLAQQWNALSDCFQISHRGSFGTINGLRLGAEAPALQEETTTSPTNRRPFLGDHQPPPSIIRVPWLEINAALGHVALLLSTLESRPHAGITLRHAVLPMGSYSKVGIRRGGSVAWYQLYSDDSFQFFGKRNFNIALQCMVECVVDAVEAVQKRDRTIAVPHLIEKQRDFMSVGGMSIVYGGDAVEWTRAMKYLLTDIKHLLTYRALNLWET